MLTILIGFTIVILKYKYERKNWKSLRTATNTYFDVFAMLCEQGCPSKIFQTNFSTLEERNCNSSQILTFKLQLPLHFSINFYVTFYDFYFFLFIYLLDFFCFSQLFCFQNVSVLFSLFNFVSKL